MSKLRIVQLCAMPGTGKNSIVRALHSMLTKRDGDVWLLNDNEYGLGGYSPLERHFDSLQSGVGLDTPEFARQFNLPRQLRYQEMTRQWATAAGKNVLMPGPFENLYSEIPHPSGNGSKIPLLQKMREFDFGEFELRTIQVVLVPQGFVGTPTLAILEDEKWVQVVGEEFGRRMRQRFTEIAEVNPSALEAQSALDAKKLDDLAAYVRTRYTHLIKTSQTMGTPMVIYEIGEDPAVAAERLLSHI